MSATVNRPWVVAGTIGFLVATLIVGIAIPEPEFPEEPPATTEATAEPGEIDALEKAFAGNSEQLCSAYRNALRFEDEEFVQDFTVAEFEPLSSVAEERLRELLETC